jgi:selT/selW/selH-like putative selenoprotein
VLIEGGGGDFEVTVDGSLIFSRRKTGGFPEVEDIIEAIRAKK